MRKTCLFVLAFLMSIMFSVLAFASLEISPGNFPDEEFRKIVKKYDTNSDSILTAEEIAAIQEIDCEKNENIKDVTGIEYFTSLKSLSVWKCSLSKLDVSKNTQLAYLDCCETGIAFLDVRYNRNIHQLWCYGNKITDLDLTNNLYLVKAYSNGIYKSGTYISYADEETESYIALDKTVKLKLPAGTPSSGTGTTPANPGTPSSGRGTTPANPGTLVAMGETVQFDREVTIPGDFLDQAFKVECEDIVSITQARTGNIHYSNGTTYYFTIWVTGKKPGTTTVTVYDNSKTTKIWSTVITVYGEDPEAEIVGEDTSSSGTSANSGASGNSVTNGGQGTGSNSGTSASTNTSTTVIVSNGKYKQCGSTAVLSAPKNKNITSLTIPATVKIGGKARKVTSIAANAFKGCSKLKTVTIGKNVTSIGANAFSGCKALTKVSIGAGVKTIGKNAFLNCVKLKTVSGGKGLTTIGASAFSGCKVLTKITLYGKVKKIGAKAFYKCSKLKTITVKTSKLTSKTVGANAFKGIYAKAAIKVPKAKLKAYSTLLKKKGVGKKVAITK